MVLDPNLSNFFFFLMVYLSIFSQFQAHFVEMDPWVVSEVLRPNLESTGFLDFSVIHTVRVENFLANAEQFLGIYMLKFLHLFAVIIIFMHLKRIQAAQLAFIEVEFPPHMNQGSSNPWAP